MKAKNRTTPDIDAFRKILKDKGLKATPQRLAVHGAMMELGHASADMVVEYMSEHSGTAFSVASVYNTLTMLAERKIYRRRTSSNNKMYFDVNTFPHLHIYDCVNNEYRDVIDDELLELVEAHFKGRRFRGYKLDSIDIQLVCRPSRSARK